MASGKTWITGVKDELKKSSLMTNTILTLALTGLEKITEMEFVCPCSPEYNARFSTTFFALPCVLVFLLMMITRDWRGWRCDFSLLLQKNIAISTVPAVVWLILVFMDGQYSTCFMTSWNGTYVFLNRPGPSKWCEPEDPNFPEEYMTQTQRWFFVSQCIGIGFAFSLTTALGIYTIYFFCNLRKAGNPGDDASNAGSTNQPRGQQVPESVPLNPGPDVQGGAADGNAML